MQAVKRRFSIYHNGKKVGESWAVSEEKAINNYWWRECKRYDQYAYTDYRPCDFVAMDR